MEEFAEWLGTVICKFCDERYPYMFMAQRDVWMNQHDGACEAQGLRDYRRRVMADTGRDIFATSTTMLVAEVR